VREPLPPGAWPGIALISAESLPWRGFMALGSIPPGSTVFALLNAVVITAYTLVDGSGFGSGHAASYILWLFFLIPCLFWRGSF